MLSTICSAMDAFITRIESQKATYAKIHQTFGNSLAKCINLNDSPFASEVIELFGPSLNQKKARVDLKRVYEGYYHPKTGSLIIATSGTTLLCRTPSGKKQFILRHIGCNILHPSLGIEIVNVGLVGDIYSGPVIVRSESACAPSFLFSTERCNCCYQWGSTREIAGHLHPITPPSITCSEAFERWVESQFTRQGHRHIPAQGGPGVLLLHFDSQGGMGSGYSPGEFCYDLGNRALLRQLGENSVEQLCHLSIKEGYEAIGVIPDARKEEDGAGYQILPIILDWLDASREIVMLSNNNGKLGALTDYGYQCQRIQSLGKIDQAGLREAKQRNQDFKHLDIGNICISFEEEIERLKFELGKIGL